MMNYLKTIILLLAFSFPFKGKAQHNFTFTVVDDYIITIDDESNSDFVSFEIIGNCNNYSTEIVEGGTTNTFNVDVDLSETFGIRRIIHHPYNIQYGNCWQMSNNTQIINTVDTVIIDIPDNTYDVLWTVNNNTNDLTFTNIAPSGIKILNTIIYHHQTLSYIDIGDNDYYPFIYGDTYWILRLYEWQGMVFKQEIYKY